MKKLLDISKDAVKAITIQAATEGTVFKLKAQKVLEDYAKPLIGVRKQKGVVVKKKK